MTQNNSYTTVRNTRLYTGLANALLAVSKLIAGITGNSAALIADGLHSFSDLVSDILVIFAAKAGDKGPDTDHPYGHRRIETLTTIIISLLLIGIAVIVCYEALKRALNHGYIPIPQPYVLVMAAISIAVNEALYRYNKLMSEKVNSKLLLANALHNRGDALSSGVTLLAVGGAMTGMTFLDPIGAIIIGLLILRMGIKMIYDSVSELIDTAADPETVLKIKKCIDQCEGVIDSHEIRTRLHGSQILVDCHILVDSTISVSEGHYIGDLVRLTLMQTFENITDITVHIDPEDDEIQNFSVRPSRASITQQLEKACHHCDGIKEIKRLQIHYINDGVSLELTLPLSILEKVTAEELQQQYDRASEHLDFHHAILLSFQT